MPRDPKDEKRAASYFGTAKSPGSVFSTSPSPATPVHGAVRPAPLANLRSPAA
jgi:hypothetical protein